MATSGTYGFDPSLVDIVLDAFDRCEIRPSAITPDHLFSARRSLNQVFVKWANKGINLWSMDEVSVPIVSGQQVYECPEGTVAVFEVWTRTYQMGQYQNAAPAFTTTNLSTTVGVTLLEHGLSVGEWVAIVVPVSIGGIVVSGFYQVTEVTGVSTLNITAANAATSTDSGGVVPVYDTVAGSEEVTVTLPDHGFVSGDWWVVSVQTQVGGLSLLGQYQITSTTTNTLTFDAPYNAGSTDSVAENGGQQRVSGQAPGALPQDRMMGPLSRTDWAAITTKQQPSNWPTSFWFDRKRSPRLYLWPLPVSTTPMELRYFRMTQIQDANPQGTETPDIPYRFEEALCADLAVHLAMKWAKSMLGVLVPAAKEAWAEAASEDRERVTLNLYPEMSGYYN